MGGFGRSDSGPAGRQSREPMAMDLIPSLAMLVPGAFHGEHAPRVGGTFAYARSNCRKGLSEESIH